MRGAMFRYAAVSLSTFALAAAVIIGCASDRSFQPTGEAGRLTARPGFASRDQFASRAMQAAMPPTREELWVIEKRPAQQEAAPATQPVPGCGALVTRNRENSGFVPIPLKHTDVSASISGYIASVNVKQQFHNPFSEKIEAVYVFPLPENAAVNEFIMTIGERRIRGIIREREEAQRIYAEARGQGYVASLLTQERPNVFTQSVANIEPGKAIDIDIKYFHTLTFADGAYEFVFPMVVGPRFNPPGSKTGIGAVAPSAAGKSGQSTEVQYLRPEERNGHEISLVANIDAGVAVEQVECRSHKASINRTSPRQMQVTLDPADNIPNRDFVLRYKIAGSAPKAGLLARRDEQGGYFTLMLVPPENLGSLPRQPLEMVFTLDVSGSMSGRPIEQAKAAMRYALTHMRPDDTLQIVRFAGNAEQMAPTPVPATDESVRGALQYLEGSSAGGGTMMLEGIRSSLSFQHDESRLRFVSFLTDGWIGNEAEILGELRRSLGPARVFSFGVGNAPNRYLLDHMAKLGRGAAAYLSLQDEPTEVMADYFNRISHPALTDISIDWGAMEVSEVFPRQTPDLFVGRPVILTGRFKGELPSVVKINGRVGNERQVIEAPLAASDAATDARALPAVWARAKISDLSDQAAFDPGPSADFLQQVRGIALEYGLMSPMTSFVAVDSLTRTAGGHGTTVAVPVPLPPGTRYETTVSE